MAERLGDPEMAKTAWSCLSSIYQQSQRRLGTGQWQLLAEAAESAGIQTYYFNNDRPISDGMVK